MGLSYKVNSATSQNIIEHLLACDTSFIPHLSKKIDINNYSIKIRDFATTFEAWNEGVLVGLVAMYTNGVNENTAFITNVSVDPKLRGKGIARELLFKSQNFASHINLAKIKLQVNRQNKNAINLYINFGFEIESINEDDFSMIINLNFINEK